MREGVVADDTDPYPFLCHSIRQIGAEVRGCDTDRFVVELYVRQLWIAADWAVPGLVASCSNAFATATNGPRLIGRVACHR